MHDVWLEGPWGRLDFAAVIVLLHMGTFVPQSQGTADNLPSYPEQQETGTAWAVRAALAASAVPAVDRAPRAPTGKTPTSSSRTPG